MRQYATICEIGCNWNRYATLPLNIQEIRRPQPLKCASHASSIAQIKAYPSIIESTLWPQPFSIQCVADRLERNTERFHPFLL